MSDITLGQYFPGDSVLHRVDPRIKIIITLLYIITVFLADSITGFAFIVLYTFALVMLSHVPVGIVLRGLKPIIIVVLFTAIVNIFWTKGESPLIEFGFVKVYFEGIMYALLMIIRITALLAGTGAVLTYTTSPISITDGIERLLAPLQKIHIPVHEFAMMMTIALRFIPTLIRETEKIMNAQKARGTDFTNGSLMQRIKALTPILIPLFISSFRRADELATAMECRCYRGGDNRTRMTILHIKGLDVAVLLAFVLAGVCVIALNKIIPIYSI